jgi:hypothetical protein
MGVTISDDVSVLGAWAAGITRPRARVKCAQSSRSRTYRPISGCTYAIFFPSLARVVPVSLAIIMGNLGPAWTGFIKSRRHAGQDRSHFEARCKTCVTVWVQELVDGSRDEWDVPSMSEAAALDYSAPRLCCDMITCSPLCVSIEHFRRRSLPLACREET